MSVSPLKSCQARASKFGALRAHPPEPLPRETSWPADRAVEPVRLALKPFANFTMRHDLSTQLPKANRPLNVSVFQVWPIFSKGNPKGDHLFFLGP